jgi:hypothetical protein
MPLSFLVIDDFLDHAKALREHALRLTYPEVDSMYPGRNSLERIELAGLSEEVSRLVGERLVPMPPTQAHAKCRIALAGDRGNANIHVDTAHWSGVLYLSRPEDCQGGTEFYRHLPSNTDRAPINDAEARQLGGASAKQWIHDVLNRDTVDASKWEMTMRVPMRFNRLILLRPWLWHTAGESFGTNMENGRLVYLMFFAAAGHVTG